MRILFTTTLAAGFAAATALPVLAASHTGDPAAITCADFMAMDADAQMAAVESMHEASMQSDTMGQDENASEGEMAEEDAMAEEEAGGGMSSDSAASEDTMGQDENASEGEMAEEDAMEGGDSGATMSGDMIATVSAGCEGHPEMMAMDAMMSDM